MKNVSILFSLLVMLVVVCGCGCHRYLPVQTNIRDSVAVRYHDSTVFHIETIRIPLPTESSSAIVAQADSSHLETGLAESTAYVDSTGRLHHDLHNKPVALEKEIPIPEHFHEAEQLSHHYEVRTETVEIERMLSWWEKLWMTSGKIFWGLSIGLILYFAVRLLLKRLI